jgi:hypothetical protein
MVQWDRDRIDLATLWTHLAVHDAQSIVIVREGMSKAILVDRGHTAVELISERMHPAR